MDLLDRFNRSLTYLRLSVTDRCNLRCRYCMPAAGVTYIPHNEILRYEELTDFTRCAVKLGIRKVRLTGGEPLVRKGIVKLVAMLRSIPGIEELCMTTNGILLAEHARALAEAGLDRVNISLDTLDAGYYARLTRGGRLELVLAGIEAAAQAGLTPIKLNCVVHGSSEEKAADAVARFAREKGYQVQFIRKMELAAGQFSPVEGGDGGNCRQCNRLRLTSNGLLKPCLMSDLTFDIRRLGAEQALLEATRQKPAAGLRCTNSRFNTIGG